MTTYHNFLERIKAVILPINQLIFYFLHIFLWDLFFCLLDIHQHDAFYRALIARDFVQASRCTKFTWCYQINRRREWICTCSAALFSVLVCSCHQHWPARHINPSALARVSGAADGPGLMLGMQPPPAMDLIKAFEKRQALITCGHIRAYQLSLLNSLQIISGLLKSND